MYQITATIVCATKRENNKEKKKREKTASRRDNNEHNKPNEENRLAMRSAKWWNQASNTRMSFHFFSFSLR